MKATVTAPPEAKPDAASGPTSTASVGPALDVSVFGTVEAAEGPWRALERTAVLTPYQRYDWIKALIDSRGLDDARCAITLVHDGQRPLALFPFAIHRRFGVAAAEIIGADIGNAGWLPMERDAAQRLTPGVLMQLFTAIAGEAGGIDVIFLRNQPESWGGLANPLLTFPHQPAPDHFYSGSLADGPNNKRLRNILRGKRRLEETFGPVTLRHAETPEEVDAIHDIFLHQRSKRFAGQGIDNIFAENWAVDFFRRAAKRALGSERPALRLHALYAGGDIVATSCGSYCGAHFSQYINSTTDGPAAKSSLMGLLMHELRAELTAEGIVSIDMGLGDFDYKTDWTGAETVYDAGIPLTSRGRLLAPLLLALRRLKRAIKQNETLFHLLKRLRATLRRTKSA